MSNTSLASFVFWTSTSFLLVSGVLLPEIVSFLRSDYSSIANHISELGAESADYALFINYFSFLPIAVFSAICILSFTIRLSMNKLTNAGLILWVVGLSLGYLSAFFFPCDYGCPIEGSTRQMIHNLAGLVAYPVGTVGLLLVAAGLRQGSMKAAPRLVTIVAILTAIGFVMMLIPEQANLRGLWQRLADYSMFALIVILGGLFHKCRTG